MDLSFIPRRRIVEALEQGFRLVPGHEYDPLDWAILMDLPERPPEVTTSEIRQLSAILRSMEIIPSKPMSNLCRGSRSSHYSKLLRRRVSA